MNITSRVGCTLLLTALGCGSVEPGSHDRAPGSAALDSGNARFAAGDHAAALEHYRAAAGSDTSGAAWFGIYMASLALGDTATAADALAHVEQMVPDAAWREHPHDPSDPPPTSPSMPEHAAPPAR